MCFKDLAIILAMTCNKKYEKRIEDLEERLEGIIEWYEEHPTCDPNLYEWIEVAADAAKYVDDNTEYRKLNGIVNEKELTVKELKAYRIYKNTDKLAKIVLNRLKEKDLAYDSDPLYGMAANPWISMLCYSGYKPVAALVDKNVAGVGLYIAQLRRKYKKLDEEIEKTGCKELLMTTKNVKLNETKYTNEMEYCKLKDLMDLIRTKEEAPYESRERVYSVIERFIYEPISFHNYQNFEFKKYEDIKVKSKKN